MEQMIEISAMRAALRAVDEMERACLCPKSAGMTISEAEFIGQRTQRVRKLNEEIETIEKRLGTNLEKTDDVSRAGFLAHQVRNELVFFALTNDLKKLVTKKASCVRMPWAPIASFGGC